MKTSLPVVLLIFTPLAVVHSPFYMVAETGERHTEASVFTQAPVDHKAVYFEKYRTNHPSFDPEDDATALQSAIDRVAEQSGGGIVFIPEGTYYFGQTVRLWRGIRLIGYGKVRPVFKIRDNSPYHQKGNGKYLIHFCHTKPKGDGDVADANNNTFFSGISNINFDLGKRNPAAVAVRFHVSQHSFLSHIHFKVNSSKGAIEEIGNLIENCTFTGGEWAIKTGNTAPGWPVTLLNCNFSGQRSASIVTVDAGMTILGCRFFDTPVGIKVPSGNEQLFVKDSWFEQIGQSAVDVNNYFNPETQINIENTALKKVPYLVNMALTQGIIASVPDSALHIKSISPVCYVKNFSHGLHLTASATSSRPERKFTTINDQVPEDTVKEFNVIDFTAMPACKTWKNICELGAAGDGNTDCTQLLKQAIRQYKVIYLPMGRYLVSETLELHDSTHLIGLHPALTRIVLKSHTQGFTDSAKCKPVLVAPSGGSNLITGIGFDLEFNPGAIGLKWQAGSSSVVNDVFFSPANPSDRAIGFGIGQSAGIWVTDGGGGIFKNIWAPDDLARCPFFISNTKTPGKMIEVSLEHHKEVELKVWQVSNWEFFALQTEENNGGEQVSPVIIENSSQIRFANLLCYRVAAVSVPHHAAVLLNNVEHIMIKGMHVYSSGPFPFDHSICETNTGMVVSHLKFTMFSFL